MSYRVIWRPGTRRRLKGICARDRDRILERVAALAENPRPHPQSRALAGDLQGMSRLRVGDWRVAYSVEDAEGLVVVWRVGARGGFY